MAAAGVDFAMIRVGYRGYTAGRINPDPYWEHNIAGALAAGLDVGIYFYSQATSMEEALEEADWTLERIAGYGITYPVVFDWERVSGPYSRTSTTSAAVTACAQAFCERIEAAARNVLPMFFLELATGLRSGELLALLWEDVDGKNQSIFVSKSVSGLDGELVVSKSKTEHSMRTILIPQQAVDLLVQEHALHQDNVYLFPSPATGGMYSPETVARIHKRILKDAGLETCRFHDLRHTYATLALQNGVDIKTLSRTLGHYSPGFTLETYTHVTKRMQENAAEKMGQFLEMKL